jgi:hypothetical protein
MQLKIEDVMDRHFDRENYLTWVAMNILMDNGDTQTQNFFLYSPLNSEKWYFLPWDYDGAWEIKVRPDRTTLMGLSTYWGSVLHNRFFRSEENVSLLKNKIDELYSGYINAEIGEKAKAYRDIIEPYLSREPDIGFLPESLSKLDKAYADLPGVPLRAIEEFEADVQKPKPFFLGEVERLGTKFNFVWDHSYDIQGDDIDYGWILARDPSFLQVVESKVDILENRLIVKALLPAPIIGKS